MAAGSSAPELFTAIVTVLITGGSEGLGAIVGSAVFNIMIIVGLTAVVACSSGAVLPSFFFFFFSCSFLYFIYTSPFFLYLSLVVSSHTRLCRLLHRHCTDGGCHVGSPSGVVGSSLPRTCLRSSVLSLSLSSCLSFFLLLLLFPFFF